MASVYDPGLSLTSPTYNGQRNYSSPSGPIAYERPLSRLRSPSPSSYPRYSPRQSAVYEPYVYSRPSASAWTERGALEGLPSSPDRYTHDAVPSRGRSNSWQSQDSRLETGSSGRKEKTPRMFEPSEHWKKTNGPPGPSNYMRSPEKLQSPVSKANRSNALRQGFDDDRHYRPAPPSDDHQQLPRYDSYRPTYDENFSSVASSRTQSITRRRSSPVPQEQSVKPKSPNYRLGSYSSSRSSSRGRSSVSPLRKSGSHRTSHNISRLPRRSGSSSSRHYSRRPLRSPSRSRSRSDSRSLASSRSHSRNRRRSLSRGRSGRRRISHSPSVPATRSDSIASSRASPVPSVPIIQPIKLPAVKESQSTQSSTEPILPELKARNPFPLPIEQQPTPPLEDVKVSLPVTTVDGLSIVRGSIVPTIAEITTTPLTTTSLQRITQCEVTIKQEIDEAMTHEVPDRSVPGPMEEVALPTEPETRFNVPLTSITRDVCLSSPTQCLGDALRVMVMTRILCDRQTRQERVEPILRSNFALLSEAIPVNRLTTTPEELLGQIMESPRSRQMVAAFSSNISNALTDRFRWREITLATKIVALQKRYLELNKRWKVHCMSLDAKTKPASGPEMGDYLASSRTTRRTATLGDMVIRSDLEMEQIIASLGNDEATDPAFLSNRNHAIIPDMICVEQGAVDSVFDDSNLLVHNPADYYRPHTGMDDWTPEEESIFLDRFAANPKQFGIIADGISHKTAAQCVAFYYLRKKRIDFRKVVATYAPKRRRRRTGKQKANALLADIRQHDAEVSRDNEAMGVNRGKRRVVSRRLALLDEAPTTTPTPEPEGRQKRRRAIAGRSGITEEMDDEEDDVERPTKRARKSRKPKSAAMVDDTMERKLGDRSDTPQRRKHSVAVSQWSNDDKQLFLNLLAQHGTDFKQIASFMPNQTIAQVSSFYKANIDEVAPKEVAARGSSCMSSTAEYKHNAPIVSLSSEHPDHFIPYMPIPMHTPMYSMPHHLYPGSAMYMPTSYGPYQSYAMPLPPHPPPQPAARPSNVVTSDT